MNDMKMHAKMKALKDLKKYASDMMGDDMANEMGEMKKVMVASPSKSGLKEGLEKAEDVLEEMPESEDSEYQNEMEPGHEEMTPEEIDEKIAHLQEMKRRMMSESEEE